MDGSTRRGLASTVAASLILALAAGCSKDNSTTGPGGTLDPVQTSAAMDSIVASFDGNEALQSLNAIGGFFGTAFGLAPVVVPAEPGASGLSRAFESLTLQALAISSTEPQASLQSVIPSSVLGTTFVYDTLSDKYVASGRTGAPANGIRFILYAVNPVTRRPIIDTEIGYVDLVDNSDNTANKLQVSVVSDGMTFLDYQCSCGLVVGAVEVSGTGYVTDGTTKVDVDLGLQVTQSGQIVFDFNVDVPSKDLSLAFNATGTDYTDTNATFDGSFAVARGSNSISFTVNVQSQTLSGEVKINNSTVAVLSGTLDSPIVTDAEGNALGPNELTALKNLFEGAGKAIDDLNGLLAPAFGICFTGV